MAADAILGLHQTKMEAKITKKKKFGIVVCFRNWTFSDEKRKNRVKMRRMWRFKMAADAILGGHVVRFRRGISAAIFQSIPLQIPSKFNQFQAALSIHHEIGTRHSNVAKPPPIKTDETTII